MEFCGQLLKMKSDNTAPIKYYLKLRDDLLEVNQLFGKEISIEHIGYQCVNCNNDVKIFRMGFCKKCFFESPYASETIIRPELSTAHLGIEERNLEIESQIQLQPHIVYLAYTGDIKVGVTRASQIPTRWIDQGATFAIPIAKTDNRYEAGMIEVALKTQLPDKTNYKKMLSNPQDENPDLIATSRRIRSFFPEDFQQFYTEDNQVTQLDFPYNAPEKINIITLEKTPKFSGKLIGIKGQYLSFEGGDFINIRAHEGYVIQLTI